MKQAGTARGGKLRLAASSPLLGEKQPTGVAGASLDQLSVPRNATTSVDRRDDDRYPVAEGMLSIEHGGTTHQVELVNLSGGGAMVSGDFTPRLWDRVDLTLGDHGTVECAVRWIRGDRFGLEFAHETQIDGEPQVRDAMLLEVIQRNFPNFELAPVVLFQANQQLDQARRGTPRHPLIWTGTILYQNASSPVRLRNISARGALVETSLSYPAGAELFLDLGEAGSLFATVSWSRGDQLGILFDQSFDIADLAKARPELAPERWSAPDSLFGEQGDTSPWAECWGRLSIHELRDVLQDSLKL